MEKFLNIVNQQYANLHNNHRSITHLFSVIIDNYIITSPSILEYSSGLKSSFKRQLIAWLIIVFHLINGFCYITMAIIGEPWIWELFGDCVYVIIYNVTLCHMIFGLLKGSAEL